KGARETLLLVRPRVFLSVHPAHLAALGHDPSEIKSFAKSVGYSIEELDGSEIRTFRLAEYLLRPLQ
ncbi:MAG: hypothetical protein K8F25_15895, partial [Fimbriimonadaceae bacterium]|nr:hypothetical protein [Alphaproteobacteria bacterium]